MAAQNDTHNMALFCDFENVALGVRDAKNDKFVIGVGVKQSSSDLLISNCDEFIYYDDLVREDKAKAKRTRRKPQPKSAAKAVAPEAESKFNGEARVEDRGAEEPKLDDESKREDKSVQAVELVMSTLEA